MAQQPIASDRQPNAAADSPAPLRTTTSPLTTTLPPTPALSVKEASAADGPAPLRTTTSPLTTTLPPTLALSVKEASAADAMLPGLLPTPSRQFDDADLQPNATNAIAEDTATADDNAIGAEDNAIADQRLPAWPWWDNAIAERYLQDQQRSWWDQNYKIAWVCYSYRPRNRVGGATDSYRPPRWQLQILNWSEQRQLWRCQHKLQRERIQERHRLEPLRRWWVQAAACTARAKANNIRYEQQLLLEWN